MAAFFVDEIILWAVRWYCEYGISYRNLEGMIEERGVDLDPAALYRWVQHYAPEIEKHLRGLGRSTDRWHVDETLHQSTRSLDLSLPGCK
jgi:transposase, IS6 family